jgi:predicted nucleic acid-binding protein
LVEYFADSYAFFARAEGNPRYIRIFQRGEIVTSALNVLEVYSVMLTRIPEDEARRHASACFHFVVGVPEDTALPAAEFKRRMLREGRDCSTVDAWGYAASVRLGRRFLTGDGHFKGVANVAFVR